LPQRVRLPFDRWSRLSDDVKKIWDTLDDQAKAIILGSLDPRPQQPQGPAAHKGSSRRVNLHAISAYDLLHAFAVQTTIQEDDTQEPDQTFDGTLIKEEPTKDP